MRQAVSAAPYSRPPHKHTLNSDPKYTPLPQSPFNLDTNILWP